MFSLMLSSQRPSFPNVVNTVKPMQLHADRFRGIRKYDLHGVSDLAMHGRHVDFGIR